MEAFVLNALSMNMLNGNGHVSGRAGKGPQNRQGQIASQVYLDRVATCRGTGGHIIVESAATCSWNRWAHARGLLTGADPQRANRPYSEI